MLVPLRSNRTFMELKFKTAKDNQVKLDRSNRTFMELKYTSTPP